MNQENKDNPRKVIVPISDDAMCVCMRRGHAPAFISDSNGIAEYAHTSTLNNRTKTQKPAV